MADSGVNYSLTDAQGRMGSCVNELRLTFGGYSQQTSQGRSSSFLTRVGREYHTSVEVLWISASPFSGYLTMKGKNLVKTYVKLKELPTFLMSGANVGVKTLDV